MATIDKKYFAFISYKREDEAWAKWLQHKLEHYKLPSNLNGRTDLPKEIRPVFKDTSELNPGNLPQQIHDALNQSRYLIVICSPRSAKSEWVNKEVETFIGMGRTDNIIPFIIDGKAFAKNPNEECFPLAIRNFPAEQEILGANISEMGRDAAAVKVVAQMFGLKFDELWQRHEREQRRKRLMIVLGALLLAFIGIGVAIGFSQQNKKIREQNEEILNKNERLHNDSLVMAAQMDSINKRDLQILQQQDSIANINEQLTIESDNLNHSNWTIMKNQSQYIAKKAQVLLHKGDYIKAQRLLLEVLPKKLTYPDKPLTQEAKEAFLNSFNLKYNTIITKKTENINIFQKFSFASFSPDGHNILYGKGDSIIIIDADSFEIIREWQWYKQTNYIPAHQSWSDPWKGYSTPEYQLKSLSYSPDGNLILSTTNSRLYLWDAKSGTCLYYTHDLGLETACFSSDGQKILVTKNIALDEEKEDEKTGIIKVVNTATKKECCSFIAYNKRVDQADFSPDGRQIVTLSKDTRNILIWDAETGALIDTLAYVFSPCFVHYSPDGKYIATAESGRMKTWNVATGKVAKDLMCSGGSDFNYSPDNNYIATVTDDKTITIIDTKTGEQIKNLYGHDKKINSIKFSPDGRRLVSSDKKNIIVWDVTKENVLPHLQSEKILCDDYCYEADYSHDGRFIISITKNKTIKIWDAKTGKCLNTINAFRNDPCYCSPFAYSISLSPGGHTIATAGELRKTKIKIWDVKTGICLDSLAGHSRAVTSVCYSPDGKYLASTAADSTIRIWDAVKRICLDTLKDPCNFVYSVNYSPDGRHMVTVSSNGKDTYRFVRIWDVKTRAILKNIKTGETSGIMFANYSPDGSKIVVINSKKKCLIFDAQTGEHLKTFDKTYSNFDMHNDTIIVSYSDDALGIYDWGRKETSQFEFLEKAMSSIHFSSDGKHLLTTSYYGVKTWTLNYGRSLQELIDETRVRFKDRPLTPEERRMYYLE